MLIKRDKKHTQLLGGKKASIIDRDLLLFGPKKASYIKHDISDNLVFAKNPINLVAELNEKNPE